MKISRAPPRKDTDDNSDMFDLNKASTDAHEKQGPSTAKHAEKSKPSHIPQMQTEHPNQDNPGQSRNSSSGL